MKTRKFTQALLFTGVIAIMTSCSFLNGTGSVTTDGDAVCSNYINSPKSILPVKLIDSMVTRYENNQLRHINQRMGFLNKGDAKSITFDLETLKKFIYHLENAAAKNPSYPTTSEKLGIRIYYAAYPERQDWSLTEYEGALNGFIGDPLSEDYENRHTLIMVPTIEKAGVQMDFDPFVTSTYPNGIQGSSETFQSIFAFMINAPGQGSSQSNSGSGTNSQNHGQLYPPFSGTGVSF